MWAATVLPPPARTTALLFAPLLGAWSVTVQCYGGAPTQARGPAAALVGRARFREFGWASLVALGVVLTVADAIGLVLVVSAALATIGLRLYAHHRVGGLTGRLLAATREIVETLVLVALAVLARGVR
jgi:cobalamin synthase